MPTQPDKETQDSARDPAEYAQVLDTVPESEPAPKQDTVGEFLFQIFCAVIFLGMIGLVFYNAMLRYLFSSSYPPSEEWARFLFIYITFFGSIEAFYRKKHIGVVYVMSTYDQESVSTGVNMTFIYGTLPIMAAAALIIQLRDFIALLRRPVSEFEKA